LKFFIGSGKIEKTKQYTDKLKLNGVTKSEEFHNFNKSNNKLKNRNKKGNINNNQNQRPMNYDINRESINEMNIYYN